MGAVVFFCASMVNRIIGDANFYLSLTYISYKILTKQVKVLACTSLF